MSRNAELIQCFKNSYRDGYLDCIKNILYDIRTEPNPYLDRKIKNSIPKSVIINQLENLLASKEIEFESKDED